MPAETSGSAGVTTVIPSIPASPSFSARRLLDGARHHPVAADPLVERERLGQRPAVLEVVVAAGGEPRPALRPGERRDQLGERIPVAGPDDAGAARPEEPLVGAGRQEVAAELGQVDVDGAEAVHAVDAEQDPVGGSRRRLRSAIAAPYSAIGSRTPVLEWTHVTATTRVRGPIASTSRRGELVDGGGRRVVVQRDPADPGAGAERDQPQRVLGREEVVGRGQDLVAGPQVEARRTSRRCPSWCCR